MSQNDFCSFRRVIFLLTQCFKLSSFYRATQLCNRGFGSRNSVHLSVCHTRAL